MKISYFAVCFCVLPCLLFAQDKSAEPTADQVLAVAKQAVAELTGVELVDGKDEALECVGPVYSFGEPGFKIASGTLWVWTRNGIQRPAAVLSLATIDVRRFFEFHSFSENPLTFPILGGKWQPAAAWQPLELPNAPAPAETEQRRLSQMKLLTQRFKSTVRVIPGDRIDEMRILPTPIYRYPNTTKERDGAVFVVSRDGDPEALLIIETTSKGWQYMPARLSGHVPTIILDGKPTELSYLMGPSQPYFYTFRLAGTKESPIPR